MTTTRAQPYSRWRLTDMVDRLAGSYDAAAHAIDSFSRSSSHYDPMTPRPTMRVRLRAFLRGWVARRGWPRACWFAGMCICAALFVAFISARILQHSAPAALAVIPGLLLILALAGSALLTASGLEQPVRRPVHRAGSPPSTGHRALFAACLASCAAWVGLWASVATDADAWVAAIIGVASAALAGGALLIAGWPVTPARQNGLPAVRDPARLPRQLRAQQRKAHHLVNEHARSWSIAVHQCGVTMAGSAVAEAMLFRLLTSETGEVLPDLEVFHAHLLATLSRYRPDPLRQRLDESSRNLLPRVIRR